MGAYLSNPIVEAHSIDEFSKRFEYGASSMQGWRVSNEDAHSCILDYDENTSLFAVFDGHGGAEVAQYSASKLPDFIKNHSLYSGEDLSLALREAFIDFDVSLTQPEVIKQLKVLADADNEDGDEGAGGSSAAAGSSGAGSREGQIVEDADPADLSAEANIPLTDIISKFYKRLVTQTALSPVVKPKAKANGTPEESSTKSDQDTSSDKDAAEPAGSSSEKKPNIGESGDAPEQAEQEEKAEGADEAQAGPSVKSGRVAPQKLINKIVEALMKQELDEESDSSEFTCSDADDEEDDDDDEDDEEDDDDDEEAGDEDDAEDDEDNDEEEDGDDEETGDKEEGDSSTEKSRSRKMSKPLKRKQTADDVEAEAANCMMPSEPGKDSGCTAVVAIFKKDTLYVANAGDSRCVLCRDGKAIDMSADHKPEDDIERERIAKAGGEISADGRVNGGLNLSRAIGDHSYKTNKDLSPKEQMITALPDVQTCKLDPTKDEFVVLACDGIWNSMTSQQVVDFVRERIDKTEKLSKICEELFHKCLATDTSGDGTGCDNMTCIIVRTKKPNDSADIQAEPITQEQTTAESSAEDNNKVDNDEVKTNGDSSAKRKLEGDDEDSEDVCSKRAK